MVYNIGFERGKLNDLIEVFPRYSNELRGLVNRLKDLMNPFQQKWYYTPEMKGSYSIKYVLPGRGGPPTFKTYVPITIILINP
ncbi:MAG: DUF2779 domain-containing protein [Flavobacteriaceae bacterium]|nr:DUF2779 domain-containing protein [Flavobacteriaceae bacterium]MDO7599442.1 DUF2779 domain-containing protein [Flavobacteriaceae bacterium]MDO7615034.1 DUF2779 domain-containing protein [Flavobacteriaceae bacterium]